MYPVSLGFNGAIKRINGLLRNGHHAEALATSVFTVEKTMRRTLKQLVVSSGFRSTTAQKIVDRSRGLDALKSVWEFYDPSHRTLVEILNDRDWQTVTSAAAKRNKMVHGARVYNLSDCESEAKAVLIALNNIRATFDSEYGYSGWTTMRRRIKSRLHIDPKVSAK